MRRLAIGNKAVVQSLLFGQAGPGRPESMLIKQVVSNAPLLRARFGQDWQTPHPGQPVSERQRLGPPEAGQPVVRPRSRAAERSVQTVGVANEVDRCHGVGPHRQRLA